MSSAQISLHWSHISGSSQEIGQAALPAHDGILITHLRRDPDKGGLELIPCVDRLTSRCERALATLFSCNTYLQLQLHVSNVSVHYESESVASSTFTGTNPIPLQVQYLQFDSGDCVLFHDHGLKINFDVARPEAKPISAHQEETVQVKSSVSQIDPGTAFRDRSAIVDRPSERLSLGTSENLRSKSEDADDFADLDNISQSNIRTPLLQRSVNASATALPKVHNAVKETPGKERPETRDSNQLFSTARSGVLDPNETPSVDMSVSPSKAPTTVELETPTPRVPRNVDRVERGTSVQDPLASESDDPIMTNTGNTRGRKVKKYSVRDLTRRATSPNRERSSHGESSSAPLHAASPTQDKPQATGNVNLKKQKSQQRTYLTSSDPPNDQQLARAATIRSKKQESRSATAEGSDEDGDSFQVAKRRKMTAKRGGDNVTTHTIAQAMIPTDIAQVNDDETRSLELITENNTNLGNRRRPSSTEPNPDMGLPPRSATSSKMALASSPRVVIKSNPEDKTPTSSNISNVHSTSKLMVLMSNSKQANQTTEKWLRRHGAASITDIPSRVDDFICVVGVGELLMTAKLLRSLALEKPVVTDQWIVDSKSAGSLLDFNKYTHPEVIETPAKLRATLLGDHLIFFTDLQVQNYGQVGWSSIEALCREAGATDVIHGRASKGVAASRRAKTIFIGSEGNDTDARLLVEEGHTVYRKDFVTQSILRGALDLSSAEFTLDPVQAKATVSGKRKRKS